LGRIEKGEHQVSYTKDGILYYSTAETAEFLKVSPATIRGQKKRGKIEAAFYKFGRSWFAKEEIERYRIENQEGGK